MSDPEILRANERLKAIAGVLTQLATGLLAAALVKAYVNETFDVETIIWMVGAGGMFWAAWLVLGLLQAE